MRVILFFTALLLGHITYGQGTKRERVPGMNYSLMLPDNFKPLKGQPGFADSLTGASIVVGDAPTPYDTMIAEFSKENFPKHDSELLSSEPAKGPFARTVLLTARSKSPMGNQYKTLLFISGNNKMSVMVVGNYPEASPELEPVVKAAILSTTYHKPSGGKAKSVTGDRKR